jgi:iron complex transport system substrate-binding protein
MAMGLAVAAAAVTLLAAVPAAPQGEPSRAATREFTDELGRTVRLSFPPRRIVSLAPNLTEALYALGVEERVVAVTDFCDYPAAARAKPRVGGAINPSLEAILAAQPDLVLLTYSHNRRETAEALDRLGVPYYVTNPRSIQGVLASVGRLGELAGSPRADALLAGLRARLAGIERRLEGRASRRVLFVVWDEPLISVGRATFVADALRYAGAASVVATEQDWPRLSLEEVIRLEPDYLIFAASHSESVAALTRSLAQRPGWRRLAAVREGRVAVVSDAINRPAPRLIEAIEALARVLHPDAFEKTEIRNSKLEIRNSNSERLPSAPALADFRFSIFDSRFSGLPQ